MQSTSVLRSLTFVLSVGASLPSCASDGVEHPLERAELWHRYRELADVRVLAIAGDPEGVWVAGVAAGLASAAEAEREALAVCERRRAQRRMQAPCVVYAVGSEVRRENFRRRRTWP
jgi:hypothetical protein